VAGYILWQHQEREVNCEKGGLKEGQLKDTFTIFGLIYMLNLKIFLILKLKKSQKEMVQIS